MEFFISLSRHLAHYMEYHSVGCFYRAGLVQKKYKVNYKSSCYQRILINRLLYIFSCSHVSLSVVYAPILSPKEPLNLKTNPIIPWLRHGS